MNHILDFLKTIYKEFPFKKLLSDNGKEFKNKLIENWTNKEKVVHEFSIPYYHQSNGRVERVNRTLRTAINKTRGPLRRKLKNVVENYNSSYHRGIGMSPQEAVLEKNWTQVKVNEDKYKKEFLKKHSKAETFEVHDDVLIRNELKETKNDLEFNCKGKVLENIHGDVYLIETEAGKIRLKHASQLRLIKEGDVVV